MADLLKGKVAGVRSIRFILFNSVNIRYNNQIKDYNKGAKFDDAPDSLYGAVQLTDPIINYTSSDNSIATVDANGKVAFFNTGTVNITATLGFNNGLENTATSDIAITVVLEPQNNYTVDFVDAIGGYIVLNSTRTFVGNRKNNGVDEPNSQFDFEVISGTTPTDKYNLTIINDTSCTIKCLGYTYTITLRCYDRSNRLLYIDKTISLKGLI